MNKQFLNVSFMKTILIAISLVALMSLTVHASTVDMSGKWTLQVKAENGTGTPVFDLKQTGKDLTGLYTGRYGKSPLTGTVEGNSFKIAYKANDVDVIYAGKVQGNTCEGNADFGKYGKATFTGKK